MMAWPRPLDHAPEAKLRVAVLSHVLVIIEMVLREIGKRRRLQTHAVHAMLLKPMARRFHRDMRHALLGERRQGFVDRDGIGRGVPEIDDAVRTNRAQRAKARGFAPRVRPDLTQKIDRGAFAICARHRDDVRRTARIKR